MAGIGITIGRTTVADLLRQAGFDPAPRRKRGMDWKTFLKAHWQTLYACDFFSIEALGIFGPVRYMVFFVIEVHTRRVEIAGIHRTPNAPWMMQMARNLTDCFDGFLLNASHLIHDRDALFTKEFRKLLKGSPQCLGCSGLGLAHSRRPDRRCRAGVRRSKAHHPVKTYPAPSYPDNQSHDTLFRRQGALGRIHS